MIFQDLFIRLGIDSERTANKSPNHFVRLERNMLFEGITFNLAPPCLLNLTN